MGLCTIALHSVASMNHRDFKLGTILFPTYKVRETFEWWCIDLAMHLKGPAGTATIMVVAVCPFSK